MIKASIKAGLILLLALSWSSIFAQNNRISFAVSNNVTAMPVSGFPKVFSSQIHPGFEAARSWKINKHEKKHWYLNANTGFYYHRFIQTTVWLYPSLSYEYDLGQRFSLDAGLGGGYALSFEASEVFKINSDGVYEKRKTINGRSQFIGQLELGGRYALKKDDPDGMKLMLQCKNYIQGIFVANYAPALPINSVLIGVSIPVK